MATNAALALGLIRVRFLTFTHFQTSERLPAESIRLVEVELVSDR